MNWFQYAYGQVLLSQKVFWKQLGFAIAGVVVPLGLGVALPMSMHGTKTIAGIDAGVFTLVGFIGFTLFWIVYNLINSSAARRDALIYKRLRVSPLPDSAIFAGEAVSGSLVSLVQVVILVAVAALAMDAGAPKNIPLFVLAVLLGSLMFAVLAIGLSGLLPNAELGTWIVTPFMALLMFGSGVATPLSSLPDFLQGPAQFLPLTPVVEMLRTAYFGLDFITDPASAAPPAEIGIFAAFRAATPSFGIMVLWAAFGLICAHRYFRWDPRHSS
ncbi:ABC transporter permease [Nonomuraea sp. NPDC000554]|uniref:ABC transporter permease n=1 Tax=Nonomuraea sp. NPDC000554 TaxID=3154259 RepID=UPI0033277E57